MASNPAPSAPSQSQPTLLGRVAHNIFWLYRYLERAENTALLLAAGQRMALTRGQDAVDAEWKSVMKTLGLNAAFDAAGGTYTSGSVCDFVLRSPDNPESALAMIENARTNARVCRSAITAEVWEAINEGWMTLKELLSADINEGNLGSVLGAIRRESSLARGATHGSMLRNETYNFARLGTFLERADNTARILDVKYYLLLPSLSYVGTPLDTGQWDNVLRSLSAERAYRWLNSGRMEARSIARFLILDDRFPRSLAFCYSAMREQLEELALSHGQDGSAHQVMRDLDMRLTGQTVESIFEQGLHQFIQQFLAGNQQLAGSIALDYRFTG